MFAYMKRGCFAGESIVSVLSVLIIGWAFELLLAPGGKCLSAEEI